MTAVWIILILLGLYGFFVAAPAVVACAAIFSRREGMDFETGLEPGRQFHPYAARLRAGRDALLQRGAARVGIRADDGLLLRADYYAQPGNRAVIFLHGYRSDPMLNFAVQGAAFAARGYQVLLVCQRAHGDSEGRHTGLGLPEQYDLLRWVDWLRDDRGVREIVVYGMSMGASCAAFAADKLDPKTVRALILDCGFASPYTQIAEDSRRRHIPPWLLTPLIRGLARLRFGFDIAQQTAVPLAKTTIPALFLYGTADETVPQAQIMAQYEACAAPKQLYTAAGAGHTLAYPADPDRAAQTLFAFLEQVCGFSETKREQA